MNTECDICYTTTIIKPCGANNNCKAMVCHDCRFKNCQEYFTNKCYFCFGLDYKQGCITEMDVDVFEWGGTDYEPNKPYILALFEYKYDNYAIFNEEWFLEENAYCFPCED